MTASTPASQGRRVAVLGGGITGLTAAWHLRRRGWDTVVLEAAGRTGGVIGAERVGGWLHEGGPNSLLEGSAEAAALIDALGLGPRRLYAAPEAKRRYIVRGGRLVPMPGSPLAFAGTGLFSWKAKLQLLGEPFRPARTDPQEESVAQFVRRRLGREFLDYAIDPFVAGVYAGDPEQLSVRHAFAKLEELERRHGSLIRGALKTRNASGGPKGRILSFPNGLEELTDALARDLGPSVRLGCRVTGLRRGDGAWQVAYVKAGAAETGRFDAIACALPPDVLAALPIDGLPRPPGLGVLAEIAQPAVASVFLGFRRADIAHPLDGFGFLVPRVERRRVLGTLFSSTLFPGRAPDGHVALTSFVGGTRNLETAAWDDDRLVGAVREELADLVGARGAPAIVRVRRWPRAIPQYNIGYQRFKDACAGLEAQAPGLQIGGNGRDGVSLSACLASGHRLALAVDAAPSFSS